MILLIRWIFLIFRRKLTKQWMWSEIFSWNDHPCCTIVLWIYTFKLRKSATARSNHNRIVGVTWSMCHIGVLLSSACSCCSLGVFKHVKRKGHKYWLLQHTQNPINHRAIYFLFIIYAIFRDVAFCSLNKNRNSYSIQSAVYNTTFVYCDHCVAYRCE